MESMNNKNLKKDMTVYDLAVMMINGFDRPKSDMEFGFASLKK